MGTGIENRPDRVDDYGLRVDAVRPEPLHAGTKQVVRVAATCVLSMGVYSFGKD